MAAESSNSCSFSQSSELLRICAMMSVISGVIWPTLADTRRSLGLGVVMISMLLE